MRCRCFEKTVSGRTLQHRSKPVIKVKNVRVVLHEPVIMAITPSDKISVRALPAKAVYSVRPRNLTDTNSATNATRNTIPATLNTFIGTEGCNSFGKNLPVASR